MKAARRFAALALGTAALAAVPSLAPAGAAATVAQPADSFVESIGVNIHLGYAGTPYAERLPEVKQRLQELGIRHVRTGFDSSSSREIGAGVRDLAAGGIRSTLIMGSPREPSSALTQMLAYVKASLLGSVDALEGPNEYSTSGDAEWKTHLVAWQEQLYRGVKEDPELASLPVIGPSIVHGDQATLGDVSSFLDYGNIHSYPEGEGPQYKLNYYLQQAALNSASKPVMATETGYTNATEWTPGGPGENRPISEAAAAVYLPRLYLEYWSRGLARTFDYELVDEYENEALDEREDHFGLLRNDLSLKPAAAAIENLTAILDDPGPGFTPGSLEYTLGAGANAVHSVLLQKRDGSFYLALWRQQSVWDPEAKQELTPPPAPLEVSFPAGPVDYGIYEPTGSAALVGSGGPTQELSVEVGAGVTILKLVPALATPTTTQAASAFEPASILADVLPLPRWSKPRCVVPALRGWRLAAAKATLRHARCLPRAVAIVTHTRGATPKQADAKVTRVEPKAGAVLARGSLVRLFYRRPAPG